jgi:hypothetical protein
MAGSACRRCHAPNHASLRQPPRGAGRRRRQGGRARAQAGGATPATELARLAELRPRWSLRRVRRLSPSGAHAQRSSRAPELSRPAEPAPAAGGARLPLRQRPPTPHSPPAMRPHPSSKEEEEEVTLG